jgi:naphthalene 1,2-dioxygenase ferredoxin component
MGSEPQSGWVRVASTDAVPQGDIVAVTVAGIEIALYRVGEEFFATQNICSHGHARLCEGFLEGFNIECPLHQGQFDIRSGEPRREPACEPIRAYATKVVAGQLHVQLGGD